MKKKNNNTVKLILTLLIMFLEIVCLLYSFINNKFTNQILFTSIFILTLLIFVKITKKYYKLLKFFKETKILLKEIEWPKKFEIFNISITIILVTTIISIILWIIDSILFYIISNIMSIRL
ncbi:preprotein translocase subunit SecE [Buchnera aphidicola (Chaitoregma tattakana)]|uniref:preprotein translocase subunit SecE n=1 Tax=Buchnera aphidicola TaxID=9 RepID=UPI0031B88801